MAGKVFDADMALIDYKYEIARDLKQQQERIFQQQQVGVARNLAGIIGELQSSNDGVGQQIRELESARDRLENQIKLGGQRQQVVTTAGGGAVNGATTGAALGSGAYPVTSRRGPRWGRMHNGTDYATPIGTPISTTFGGTVTGAGFEGGYGKWVEVKLANGVKAFWAHLSEIVLQQGQSFGVGQVSPRRATRGEALGPTCIQATAPSMRHCQTLTPAGRPADGWSGWSRFHRQRGLRYRRRGGPEGRTRWREQTTRSSK